MAGTAVYGTSSSCMHSLQAGNGFTRSCLGIYLLVPSLQVIWDLTLLLLNSLGVGPWGLMGARSSLCFSGPRTQSAEKP